MKERPILFSGPMVRAILEGRKTQTRRLVKPQPYESEYNPGSFGVWYKQPNTETHKGKQKNVETGGWDEVTSTIKKGSLLHAQVTIDWWKDKCPYGQPGDRLWVRETFAYLEDYTGDDPGSVAMSDGCFYRADYPPPDPIDDEIAWSPSIHMPRWASRLTLEVVSVRVERLNSITEEDAMAEGAELHTEYMPMKVGFNYRQAYGALWESINGPNSWDANPWVWIIQFKRVTQ